MNLTERQQEIARRRKALWQRRYRERYIAQFDHEAAAYLASCRCIYTPELDSFCNRWYPIGPEGTGNPVHTPPHYRYQVRSWPDEALAVLSDFDERYNTIDVVLIPALVVADRPGFVVQFGWARQHCDVLWALSRYQLFLVEPTGRFGIVIDDYGVYLGKDHPSGITLEIGTWSDAG